jgi:hypothetical protein
MYHTVNYVPYRSTDTFQIQINRSYVLCAQIPINRAATIKECVQTRRNLIWISYITISIPVFMIAIPTIRLHLPASVERTTLVTDI